MDVLKQLFDGTMTLEQVEQHYDSIMDSDGAGSVADVLALSESEWTAFCHGVGFDELARWRYNGCPSKCPVCGGQITIDKFGWYAKENEPGSDHRLVHVHCLPIEPDDGDNESR